MIEQAVSHRTDARWRRWTVVLRVFQLFALTAFALGEILAISLCAAYFDPAEGRFWGAVALLLLFGSPLLLFSALLERQLRQRSVQFDYELNSASFQIFRIVYSKRRPYAAFNYSAVCALRPYPDEAGDAESRRLLRGAVVACCNAGAELLLVETDACLTRHGQRAATVVIEPDTDVLEELKRRCRGAWQP